MTYNNIYLLVYIPATKFYAASLARGLPITSYVSSAVSYAFPLCNAERFGNISQIETKIYDDSPTPPKLPVS